MRLNIAQGNYSFALGLASIAPEDYGRAREVSYERLVSRTRQLLVVTNAGSFSVVVRRQGQALPYHGLCDLEGGVQLSVLDGESIQPEAEHAAAPSDGRAPMG